jgi:hypothetical protein
LIFALRHICNAGSGFDGEKRAPLRGKAIALVMAGRRGGKWLIRQRFCGPFAPIPYPKLNVGTCKTAGAAQSNRDCVFSALEEGLARLYG